GASAALTFSFAAYIGFVNFADADKLLAKIIILLHSKADTMSHVPSCFIRCIKLALEFFSGDALFSGANEIDCQKPFSQWQVGIMENRSRRNGILITAINALVQVAFFACLAFRLEVHHTRRVATDTAQAFGPTNLFKVSDTFLFGRELVNDLKNGRLLMRLLPFECAVRFLHGEGMIHE